MHRVALPEGATRDSVKLTVTPRDFLRISYQLDDGRSFPMSKDVRLPKDALLSEISAKFEAEDTVETEKNVESGETSGEAPASTGGGGVSSLEVTVGKAVPPQPKQVEIM